MLRWVYVANSRGHYSGSSETTLDVDLTPPHGVFLVARDGTDAVGCVGLKRLDDTTGEVKHMYLAPEHRGRGLGARLLAAIEDEARAQGMNRTLLDTNGCLTEAVTMYQCKGYESIPPYNDNEWATHWFEKRLTRG